MNEPLFFTLAEVMEIHKDQIGRYGGHSEIRDYDLLRSSAAAPQATWDGLYLNSNLFEMAAAYIYYICQDHPFVDGNKRTALASGLVFLELNGITIEDPGGLLYMYIMNLASGKMSKNELESILKNLHSDSVR